VLEREGRVRDLVDVGDGRDQVGSAECERRGVGGSRDNWLRRSQLSTLD
jgi:hypothetical protein